MDDYIIYNGENFREVLAWGRSEFLAAMPNQGKLYLIYPEGRGEIRPGTKLVKDHLGIIKDAGISEDWKNARTAKRRTRKKDSK